MLQQRMPFRGGMVWASPERDMVVALPIVIKRAITIMTDEANKITDPTSKAEAIKAVEAAAKALGTFLASMDAANVKEAWDKSGLESLSGFNFSSAARWVFRTLLGYYFTAAKQATHPGDDEPRDITWLKTFEPAGA